MGPCVSEWYELPLCMMQTSFWSDTWWNNNARLPALGASTSSMTISGFSGGGAYAEAFAVVYSKDIAGAGSFAGGTYGLYLDWLALKDRDPYTSDEALTRARAREAEGVIDPLSNMNSKPMFIWWGNNDNWKSKRGDEDQTFLTALGANLNYVEQAGYGHTIPSIYRVTPDSYDGVGTMLTYLYNAIDGSSVSSGSTNWQNEGVLREFDQWEFLDSFEPWEHHGLMRRGFVYYPTACTVAGSNCKVHMALPGCAGTSLSKMFIKSGIFGWMQNNGYGQYGAANNIIMIYPQAAHSLFPQWGECFDFGGKYHWDYSMTKVAPQMRALKRMFDRVSAPFGSVTTDLTQGDINSMGSSDYQTWLAWQFILDMKPILSYYFYDTLGIKI